MEEPVKALDAGLKRKTRSIVVRDDEWDLVKAFVAAVKNGKFAECEAFVKELENKMV